MKAKTVSLGTALCIALLLGSGCGTPFKMSNLRQVRVGMSATEVESIMGTPFQKTPQPDGSQVWLWKHFNGLNGSFARIIIRDGKAADVPQDPTMTLAERKAAHSQARQGYVTANPSLSSDIKDAILKESVVIGMSADQVRLVWGNPQRINRTQTAVRGHEQWVYGQGTYLYFIDDKLTSWQDSR